MMIKKYRSLLVFSYVWFGSKTSFYHFPSKKNHFATFEPCNPFISKGFIFELAAKKFYEKNQIVLIA